MLDCALAGADIVTAGIAVYQDSMEHAFTTQGIGVFVEAWDLTVTK
jgi:transaldolase